MHWNIPLTTGGQLPLIIEDGDVVFVLGANGSGKSALIQHLVTSKPNEKIRRISAHRKAWFKSGSITLTPQSRRQFDANNAGYETQYESRWRDYQENERQSAVLFDLVAKENSRARRIARCVDGRDTNEAKRVSSENISPFVQINELLALGTLAVTLENSNDEEILAKHRDSDVPYSIAQASDGERNAALIAANVITVESGTMVLIDEPERHLHRSIIQPFLSALFAQRKDCAFVIATHEVALPSAFSGASALMVRSCRWAGDRTVAWDVTVLGSNVDLPEDLRRVILGSRQRILFVEGGDRSLDLPLYDALFPGISVVARGSCVDVERAVGGLRTSTGFHHVEAFGLIDRDGRPHEEVERLLAAGVFALDVLSVESLYYCADSIYAVAHRQAESLGVQADEMVDLAVQSAMARLKQDGLAQRMAARRCERGVHNRMLLQVPDWRAIQANENSKINVCIDSPYNDEIELFNSLVEAEDLDALVARYPLRESRVFDAIAGALQLTSRKSYEQTLLAQVRGNGDLARSLKLRIRPLTIALGAEEPAAEYTA